MPAKDSFIAEVKIVIDRQLASSCSGPLREQDFSLLTSGKMLRSRLTASLIAATREIMGPAHASAPLICAAVEMVHTASLCHDDLIDEALVRRGLPTLHRAATPAGAVLIGDLLYCGSLDLILGAGDADLTREFVARISEVCNAEIEQELVLRGSVPDRDTCLRIARGKTGPLFAIAARAAVYGRGDDALVKVVEQAGYEIGTAYQLADDLLDVIGDESNVGKSLGTDKARDKSTLPAILDNPRVGIRQEIERIVAAVLALLAPWPGTRAGFELFIEKELAPKFMRMLGWEEFSPLSCCVAGSC